MTTPQKKNLFRLGPGECGRVAPPSVTQFLQVLLFLVVDVSEASAAQISAGFAVGRLLDLSAQSSQHGPEP